MIYYTLYDNGCHRVYKIIQMIPRDEYIKFFIVREQFVLLYVLQKCILG